MCSTTFHSYMSMQCNIQNTHILLITHKMQQALGVIWCFTNIPVLKKNLYTTGKFKAIYLDSVQHAGFFVQIPHFGGKQ